MSGDCWVDELIRHLSVSDFVVRKYAAAVSPSLVTIGIHVGVSIQRIMSLLIAFATIQVNSRHPKIRPIAEGPESATPQPRAGSS